MVLATVLAGVRENYPERDEEMDENRNAPADNADPSVNRSTNGRIFLPGFQARNAARQRDARQNETEKRDDAEKATVVGGERVWIFVGDDAAG